MKKEISKSLKHIFIVGSKSMGAYGGYETFVDKLTEYSKKYNEIQYHVACKLNGQGSYIPKNTKINNKRFMYNGADCFLIKVPSFLGPLQAIIYDCLALNNILKYIKSNSINNATVYILACRIGPFFKRYVKKLHKLNAKVYINPDGHEWKRSKWSPVVKKYWKKSEELMVKYADLTVCDSINIQKYIHREYKNTKTTYIAYGTDIQNKVNNTNNFINWKKENKIKEKQYYLIVGRFVPENNYYTMIKEFIKSKTKKDLVIITNTDDRFLNKLDKLTSFSKDKRVKFVGTVYEKDTLKHIRKSAFAYLHGHEVGGTNPSLIEALFYTKLNLLLDVPFNKEVALDGALYWNKTEGNLQSLLDSAEKLKANEIADFDKKSRKRIIDSYSWEYISEQYLDLFLSD